MSVSGIHPQRWIEMKGGDTTDRKYTLITDTGKATIDYVVGLPQGQVLSVLDINLLCNAKMAQWTATNDTCRSKNDKRYSFSSKDAADAITRQK